MLGAEKVMTMTSTYDHRIIQGAESGRFLRSSRSTCRASTASTRRSSPTSASARRRARAAGPAAAAAQRDTAPTPVAAPRGRADEALLQAVQAAVSLVKAHRTHGHLAAKLDPLGSSPRAIRRSTPRPSASRPS
jgi:2-oxoglutarate dehydrogenase E1 component